MYGIFEATSPPIFMMEPMAWTGNGFLPESPLPVQFRVKNIIEAPIIPDSDPEVMNARQTKI